MSRSAHTYRVGISITCAMIASAGCGVFEFDRSGVDLPEEIPPDSSPDDGDTGDAGPLDGLELSGDVVIDTDSGQIAIDGDVVRPAGEGVLAGVEFTAAAGEGVFEVAGLVIATGAVVRARGTAALVLVSTADARIAGHVDVSAGLCVDGSRAAWCPGPGGGRGGDGDNPAAGCAPGGPGVRDGDTGGGGGGLGTDGAAGGGETDEMMAPGGAPGIVAGSPCPGPELRTLIGGSGGGHGGDSLGAGGGGGGAVKISAATLIAFAGGSIAASGAGGEGAAENGGSGGGAGGAILLEAPAIMLGSAILAANGGGGGEGGGVAGGADGGLGVDQAPGGTSTGNAGGAGASATGTAQPGEPDINDTGGGGGGAGIIRLNASDLDMGTATVSPAATVGQPAAAAR